MATVLLVRGSAAGSVASDLTTLGHTVTETSATTGGGGLDAAWGAGHDLIVIVSTESTTAQAWVAAKWAAGVPVIFGGWWTGSSSLGVYYGLATSETEQNVNGLTVGITGSHAIISGYSGSIAIATGTFYSNRLAANVKGTALATYSSNTVATAVDVGDSLHTGGSHPGSPGATATARAVYLGWVQRSSTATTDGRGILGQAVAWATETPFVVEAQVRAAGSITVAANNLAFASTPVAGDVVIVVVQRAPGVSTATAAVSGLGATWTQVYESSNTNKTTVFTGTGATTSGNVAVTSSIQTNGGIVAYLVRGLPSPTVSATVATGSGTALSGPNDATALGQLLVAANLTNSTGAGTVSSTQAPSGQWTMTTVTHSAFFGSTQFGRHIPASAGTAQVDVARTASGTIQVRQLTFTPAASDVTGTVAATLPALSNLTVSITGTHTPPGVTGTVGVVLPALSGLTASITGTSTSPEVTGTLDVSLPALSGLTVALSGDVTDPPAAPVTGTLGISLTPLSALSVSITGTTPPAPGGGTYGRVRSRPDSGCVNHTVEIYDKGGQRPIGRIDSSAVDLVRWRRIRDDISDSQVEVSSGKATADCCELLGKLEPFRHEVVVFRNGARVWEGPITLINYEGAHVSITANDVLTYTQRLIMRQKYNNAYPNIVLGTTRLRTIFEAEVGRLENIEPPINLLPLLNIMSKPTDARTSRSTLPYEKYVWEELDQMAARSGIDYTVNGRMVMMWDTHESIGEGRMLTDDDFLENVIVSIYGRELATRSAVTDGRGVWSAVSAEGTKQGIDPYYGLVELLHSSFDGEATTRVPEQTLETMQDEAMRNAASRYPAPLVVRVPDNATIDPAVLTELMPYLVPGTRFPLRATRTCRKVTQDQKLDRLTVEATEKGERANIILSPFPTARFDPSSGEGDAGPDRCQV